MLKRYFLIIGLAVLALAGCAGTGLLGQQDQTIYLVRHAEKDPGPDPGLTPDGRVRAKQLAERLAKVKLAHIYSTNYRRTRQTAAPVALAAGQPVIYYDPQDLDRFAGQLRELKGNVLVVGHSNTTPDLVAALGGEPGAPIVEAGEYDRLYRLVMRESGVETVLERYGTRWEGQD